MRITLLLLKDDQHAVDMAMMALERARAAWQQGRINDFAITIGGLKFAVAKTVAGFSVKQIEN